MISPRAIIRQLKNERKELGWKGLFKKRGWRLVLAFFVFYLIRDVILYILIPFVAYSGLSNFWAEEDERRNPPLQIETISD